MFVIVGFCYASIVYTIKHRLMNTETPSQSLPVASGSQSSKETSASIRKSFLCWNKVTPSTEVMVPGEESNKQTKRNTCNTVALAKTANEKPNQGCSLDVKIFSVSGLAKEQKEALFVSGEVGTAALAKDKVVFPASPNTNTAVVAERFEADIRKDRTTKIMFAVTLVFILSWIPTWSVYIYKTLSGYQDTITQNVFLLFGEKMFMVNTFMNPIFYILMSSMFKQRTRVVLKRLLSCKRRRGLH